MSTLHFQTHISLFHISTLVYPIQNLGCFFLPNVLPFLFSPYLSVLPFPTSQQKGTTLSWLSSHFFLSLSCGFSSATHSLSMSASGFLPALVTPRDLAWWALSNLYLQPRSAAQCAPNYIHYFSSMRPSPHSPHALSYLVNASTYIRPSTTKTWGSSVTLFSTSLSTFSQCVDTTSLMPQEHRLLCPSLWPLPSLKLSSFFICNSKTPS